MPMAESCVERLEREHPHSTAIILIPVVASRTETRRIEPATYYTAVHPAGPGAERLRLRARVTLGAAGRPFIHRCRCGVGIRKIWLWTSDILQHQAQAVALALTLITLTEVLRILREI